jgi:hypothetical protein
LAVCGRQWYVRCKFIILVLMLVLKIRMRAIRDNTHSLRLYYHPIHVNRSENRDGKCELPESRRGRLREYEQLRRRHRCSTGNLYGTPNTKRCHYCCAAEIEWYWSLTVQRSSLAQSANYSQRLPQRMFAAGVCLQPHML